MRQQRVTVVLGLLLVGFALVEWRLFRLQVVERNVWALESERSTNATQVLPAERGWILDRNGEPLASTEERRDLVFRFRDWRQAGGAVDGHLLSLLWILDGRRRGVPDVHAEVPALLDEVGRITVGEIAALQPRQRRADVLSYVEWLFGPELDASLRATLTAGAPDPWQRLADLPPFAAGRAAAARRAAEQDAALQDLGRVAGFSPRELLDAVDAAVRRADERVAAVQSRDPTPPLDVAAAATEPFRRSRELHAEFDEDSVLLRGDVSHDCQTLLAVRADALRGFSVRAAQCRSYPEAWADTAALLVGRLGAPRATGPGGAPGDLQTADEHRERLAALAALDDPSDEEQREYDRLSVLVRETDYRSTDERGLFGLESALEPVLRGKRGWISSRDGEVAADSLPPQRGLDVTLTLDIELQQAAERVLDREFGRNGVSGFPGAIVLLDPRTGEVLALASVPRPTRADLMTHWGELSNDAWGTLCDRALGPGDSGNLPPPGSTFKPLEALIALRDGLITPQDTHECEGTLRLGTAKLSCLGTHGTLSLRAALAESCNVWFYKFAEQVGGAEVMKAAELFGYGRPTGMLTGNDALARLGVPVDPGLPEWAVHLRSDPAPTGIDAMRCAIGQQRIDDVTPLQVAVAIGALGDGTLRPPQLVRSIEGYGAVPARATVDLGATAAQLDVIRDALDAVVDVGTASQLHGELESSAQRHAAQPGEPRVAPGELAKMVAGKTGTAQVGGRARAGGWLAQRHPELAGQSLNTLLPDHSWFAGYLPRRNPSLAFAILLEHTGQHGGEACVPVLADLLYEPAVQRRLAEAASP